MFRARHFKIASLLTASLAINAVASTQKLVIAHRGASAYLPEHTLPAAAMAHGLGADFIEPDVVLSRDGVPVVLHDIHLEQTTNVATVFPNRKRQDGSWYVIDFSLAELKSLTVHERVDTKTRQASFPHRFPSDSAVFQIPTLEDLIRLVQGLNRSTGRDVGLYPELKAPAFHRQEGQDLAKITLKLLEKYGYTKRDSKIFIQCFDPQALKSLRHEFKTPLRLIQLIGENSWGEVPGVDFDVMRTEPGLRQIASYADGIGPSLNHVLTATQHPSPGSVKSTGLVEAAHAKGLLVHPYTVRADQLPEFTATLDVLHQGLFEVARVDGVFTDFTDKTLAYLRKAGFH